jgi:hypothetical protein
MLRWLSIACFSAASLLAQETLEPKLEGLQYPALARSARIQGTVHFLLKPDGIELVSGHPMLVQIARQNLETWLEPNQLIEPILVGYIFRFSGDASIHINRSEEPVGDALDRFFLRLLHRRTTRVITSEICEPPKSGPVTYRRSVLGGAKQIEVDVPGELPCMIVVSVG